MSKIPKCLYPGCESAQKVRGLCQTHYQYALRLVKRGKTTWEALEAEGKALPAKRVHSSVSSWFLTDEHRIQE